MDYRAAEVMGKESPVWMAEMLAMWQAMEAIL